MSILRKKKFYITLMQNGFSIASTSHREELMHFYLLNLNQPKKMVYYYIVYLLIHVVTICSKKKEKFRNTKIISF